MFDVFLLVILFWLGFLELEVEMEIFVFVVFLGRVFRRNCKGVSEVGYGGEVVS